MKTLTTMSQSSFRFSFVAFFCCLFLLFHSPLLASPRLASAPIQGHTTANSLKLWLMVHKTEKVRLCLENQGNVVGCKTVNVGGVEFWHNYAPVTVEFTGLEPGTSYDLAVNLDGEAHPELFSFSTHAKVKEDYSFMLGSCALFITGPPKLMRPNRNGIYTQMASHPTDFMLWMGDNVYLLFGEWEKASRMQEKYTKVRLHPKTNAFLRTRPNYAIWDDHDYGPDNGDGSFHNKAATLANFKDFWANPSWGTAETPGIFSSFSFQDSDFFLLDDRYHRIKTDHETMLGAGQLTWLKESLKASTGTFKFIAHGSQVLNPLNNYECFRMYAELEELLDFIESEKISGVVFLTGDRHFTELLKVEREGMYPLYDFTCSPLTSFVRKKIRKPEDREYSNPVRVPGTGYADFNYGTVSISGPVDQRVCTLSCFDKKGKQVWEHKIEAKELSW